MTDIHHSPAPLWRRLLPLLLALLLVASDALAEPEVRLLIDVSGSMRENDPKNLRAPALRLVNELLPAGTEAGVWLFAEETETLAAPGTVDDDWKRKTRARLSRIHSRGLRTDIERAIDTAIAGWEPVDGDADRHLVLLTDGIVDVSKDDTLSEASRARIASAQIERLKTLGVKVHTVALSDKVDMPLMRQLSTETEGWLETAQNADSLQRIFLHMLEQAAAPTTVPLKGNRFEIDDQVSELTLLAFRAEGAETKLVTPKGKVISAKDLPSDATWRAEAGYDLVTLASPPPGSWTLQGVQDADNRVVVVTDLNIATSQTPPAVAAGDALELEVWLTEHGQPVKREDLLQVLTASAEIVLAQPDAPPKPEAAAPEAAATEGDAAGQEADSLAQEPAAAAQPAGPMTSAMTLAPKTGRFRTEVDTKSLAPGVYEVKLVIDSGTFKRQAIKRFRAAGPPLSVELTPSLPTEQDPQALLRLQISGDEDLIDQESLVGYLRLQAPDQTDTVIEIPASTRLPLGIKIPIPAPGEYRVSGQLIARQVDGELAQIALDLEPVSFDFEPPEQPEEPEEEGDSPPLEWLNLALYLLGGNLALALLLGPTWLLLRHPKSADAAKGDAAKGKKAGKGKPKKKGKGA